MLSEKEKMLLDAILDDQDELRDVEEDEAVYGFDILFEGRRVHVGWVDNN